MSLGVEHEGFTNPAHGSIPLQSHLIFQRLPDGSNAAPSVGGQLRVQSSPLSIRPCEVSSERLVLGIAISYAIRVGAPSGRWVEVCEAASRQGSSSHSEGPCKLHGAGSIAKGKSSFSALYEHQPVAGRVHRSGQCDLLRRHSQPMQRQQSCLSAAGRNSAFATHGSQPVIRRASMTGGVCHGLQFLKGRCVQLVFEPRQLFQHFGDLTCAG